MPWTTARSPPHYEAAAPPEPRQRTPSQRCTARFVALGSSGSAQTNGLFTICRQVQAMRTGSFAPGLALLSLLTGCGPAVPVGIGVVSAASIPIFHRSPVDMVASAASGRDCSVVNLDKGERYCRPKDRVPQPPEFCTRSLGVPDCWTDPSKLTNHPKEIADGPRSLTDDQEADRTRHWPWLW
jgi:hypothetical protein